MTIRLKIEKHDDENIRLAALGEVKRYGFGTFLVDLLFPRLEQCSLRLESRKGSAALGCHRRLGATGGLSASVGWHWRTSRQWHPM